MKLLRKIFHLLFRTEIIPTKYVLKYRKWLERREINKEMNKKIKRIIKELEKIK